MNDSQKHSMIMELEDALQEAEVFRNGFRPEQTAHSDSYMTIVDYDSLESFFAKEGFSPEQWQIAVNYFLTNPNMQPPLKLVAYMAIRRLKLTNPIEEESHAEKAS